MAPSSLMMAGSDILRSAAAKTPPPIEAEITEALMWPVMDMLRQDAIPPVVGGGGGGYDDGGGG